MSYDPLDHDFERGMRNRRSVLGDQWVDRSVANATNFNADFQNLITRFAWNEIWGRPGLDHKTRRIIVLAITIALGRWEEFELHVRAGLTAAGLDAEIWQCPVVLLADVRSVGVMGDGRTYGHPIVLRPVSSEDAMTADWTRLPYDLLATISNRITNEVDGVNRVVLDVTSKPPGTIEWE